jgi:pimeloyl-ACP methyl ester carboxylesterase
VCFCGAGTASAQAHYQGAIGPGAFYEIDVPAAWNGDLVLYSHGILQASLRVVPSSAQEGYALLRSHLLSAGFAVAASSFSSAGWSLADVVRRTHQLNAIVASHVGPPMRTYLLGRSMGALAIIKLAEQHPGQYAGVLSMCGPLGGGIAELQYAGDARVSFDYYFPDVLPGTPFNAPPGTQFLSPLDPGGPNPLFSKVFTALANDPTPVFYWATAARLPFSNPDELASSALYMVGFLLRYTNDFIERVDGKIPFDNQSVRYQVNNTSSSVLLNAGVERFTADRAALNYYERDYTPTGQIDIPVVTLHTTRDPAVPISHEAMFAASVAAAGHSQWLVQRSVDRWGHCAFTAGEMQAAFTDLVGWVSSGHRP